MKVIFSEIAKLESDDAVAYYELEYEGLGQKFKEEVRTAIKRILQHPEAWSIESGDLFHKFPHKLLYAIEKGHILIIAVAHQHRRPNYWVYRKKP